VSLGATNGRWRRLGNWRADDGTYALFSELVGALERTRTLAHGEIAELMDVAGLRMLRLASEKGEDRLLLATAPTVIADMMRIADMILRPFHVVSFHEAH
jgi:hypothetical protein